MLARNERCVSVTSFVFQIKKLLFISHTKKLESTWYSSKLILNTFLMWIVSLWVSVKQGNLVQFFTGNFQIHNKGYLQTTNIFTPTHKHYHGHF